MDNLGIVRITFFVLWLIFYGYTFMLIVKWSQLSYWMNDKEEKASFYNVTFLVSLSIACKVEQHREEKNYATN